MIVRCPSCSTGFELPDEVLGDGRKVRCNQCQNVWFATPDAPEPAVEPEPVMDEAAGVSETEPAAAEEVSEDETAVDENAESAAAGGDTDSDAGEPEDQETSSDDGESDGAPDEDVDSDEISEASGEDQDEDEDQDGDDGPGESSLAATLAAIKEEAAEENLDTDDDDDDIGSIDIDAADDVHGGSMDMSRPIMIGWVALPVFLIVVIAGFFIFHDSISKAWPPSNQLYNLFGMGEGAQHEAEPEITEEAEAAVDPREFISMEYSARVSELADGTPALLVQGTITNSADFDVELAPMRGILRNRLNQNIHEWDFDPPDTHVGAGRVLPFTTSVADPPREMSGLEVFLLWPEDQ